MSILGPEPLIICGAGGHATACLSILEYDKKYRVAGFLDPIRDQAFFGYPYLGGDDVIERLIESGCRDFFIGVGQIKTASPRKILFNKILDAGGRLPSFFANQSFQASRTKIGDGCVFLGNSLVNTAVEIGDNCIINSGAIVEHDCRIGDHCHISTGVIINGNCKVGSGVFIGSGAVIHNGVEILPGAVIKSGSVVRR